ncbi:MAG: hypothetical protein ACOX5G_02290 [Kiritimatiellia bacterium]
MIKLIENAMTRKKSSLNFMDQNGKVVGFNPRPDGNPLGFYVYNAAGEMIDTEGKFIEQYLDGLPYSFGKDGHIIKHGAGSLDDDKLVISLLPDDGSGGEPLVLHIICLNSLYYTASFVLSEEDKLFFRPPSEAEPKEEEPVAALDRALAELTAIRKQVAKAMAGLNDLKRKLAGSAARGSSPKDA